ncbi:MAG: twin-arginine translocase subunit TatC [Planctomycetes bacterium]|nr:twin-arginine translocase subunit TatC [Planctomycetota bacterium]
MADSDATSEGDSPSSNSTRMTIGEHLEELRTRLVRSLIALVAACLLCIWPAKFLLALIARPVVIVLRRHGMADSFLATSPVEAILIYIKVVVISALILSAPYIICQLWAFVAVGLYKHEKKWAYQLVPLSVGLFLAGVLFMYTLVLLVSLNFLVGFANWIPLPTAEPNVLERSLIGMGKAHAPATQPGVSALPPVLFMETDPLEPAAGELWFNLFENKLKLRGTDQTFSVQLRRDDRRGLIDPHFRIGEYLTFVLIMTIAFGLAFQMPLVVYFLARSGIVPVQVFRSYRKVVILVIIFIAGMLAPPDLVSHLLLSGPMILLFELGLFLAARKQKVRAAA